MNTCWYQRQEIRAQFYSSKHRTYFFCVTVETGQERHQQRFQSHKSSVKTERGKHRVIGCIKIARRHFDCCDDLTGRVESTGTKRPWCCLRGGSWRSESCSLCSAYPPAITFSDRVDSKLHFTSSEISQVSSNAEYWMNRLEFTACFIAPHSWIQYHITCIEMGIQKMHWSRTQSTNSLVEFMLGSSKRCCWTAQKLKTF